MSERDTKSVQIFTARACAAPLEEAAKRHETQTGVHVAISACNRHCASPVAEEAAAVSGNHDFLVEIAEDGIYDLAISGADYLLDDGEIRGIVQKGERQLFAYRRSAIVVPAGNPAGIRGLSDLARPGVRVAISMIDCLKGLWEDVTARLGLAAQVQRNITFRANGCVAIVEALAQRKADAAIAWSAFAHLAEGRIEIIETPRDQQVWRATSVALLTTSKQPEPARAFMRFLGSPDAAAFYAKYGWAAAGPGGR